MKETRVANASLIMLVPLKHAALKDFVGEDQKVVTCTSLSFAVVQYELEDVWTTPGDRRSASNSRMTMEFRPIVLNVSIKSLTLSSHPSRL